MFTKLQFWTIVAGVLAFVAKFFYPNFPFDAEQILAAIVFLLGLFGLVPQMRLLGVSLSSLVQSKAFWTMVAGLLAYVIHYYAPEFPLTEASILAVILFVLQALGINPELRKLGLM